MGTGGKPQSCKMGMMDPMIDSEFDNRCCNFLACEGLTAWWIADDRFARWG